MEDDVAVRLQKWADAMGYVHRKGAHFDSSPDFNKVCKNKTRLLWEQTIATVKPLSQLDHIRKNILLSRIRNGTQLQPGNELSGSLGQEVKRKEEMRELRKQKQALMDRISVEEAAIRHIQQDLKKKYARRSLKQNQIKEAQLKSELFRIKKADAESFISWLDETHNIARSLGPTKVEVPAQPGKDIASPALEKCIKLVEEYQTWCKESDKAENILPEDDEQQLSEREKRKFDLWKAVTAFTENLPTEQVWNCLLNDTMEKSVSGMAALASSVDVRSELYARSKATVDEVDPERNLSAVYLKTMATTAEHFVQAEVLNRKLDRSLKQKVGEVEECVPADLNQTKPSRDRILDLLHIRCRLVQLEDVKKSLTESAARLNLESRDLASCAQRLKEEKTAITRLDNEIAEVKLSVEQGLLSTSDIKNKLRKAQQGVLEELDSFAEKCSAASDVMSNSNFCDSVSSTRSGTHRTAVFNSTALSTVDILACSTPAPNKSNCPEFFQLDETGLTITDDSTDSNPSKKCFREIVSTLRNAVASESKTFFKLPLDLVPKLKPSISVDDTYGLLTESPALIARLATSGQGLKELRRFSLSPMATDAPFMMLCVFQKLGHIRAVRLQQFTSGCLPPAELCAGMSQQYLKTTAPELDTNIRDQLKNVVTVVENGEEGVAQGRHSFNDWVRRPIQGMLPCSLQVDGKSLKDWKLQYDSLADLLR